MYRIHWFSYSIFEVPDLLLSLFFLPLLFPYPATLTMTKEKDV